MKTDINMFFFNIEIFLSYIRGPRYLHLKKVYFFGSPGMFKEIVGPKIVGPKILGPKTLGTKNFSAKGRNLGQQNCW